MASSIATTSWIGYILAGYSTVFHQVAPTNQWIGKANYTIHCEVIDLSGELGVIHLLNSWAQAWEKCKSKMCCQRTNILFTNSRKITDRGSKLTRCYEWLLIVVVVSCIRLHLQSTQLLSRSLSSQNICGETSYGGQRSVEITIIT